MSVHAFNAPSAAWRWVNCNGAPTLEAAHPEAEQSQEAKEGDAAHWAAATMLRHRVAGGDATDCFAANTGMPATNGLILTDEMVEAADQFVAEVVKGCGSDALDALHIEETVGDLASGRGGTPDVWYATIGASGGYLFIDDFKFGHRFVDAYENWQLIDYFAQIIKRPEFARVELTRLQVTFRIIQPRNYHPSGTVREWVKSGADLLPYVARLDAAAAASRAPDARTRPGPWCQDCLGRHACEALQAAADGVMDLAGGTVSLELPAGALGVELRMMRRAQKLLDARVTGLEEQAKAIIRKGERVPFFTLTPGQTRENWTIPPDQVIALGEAMGVNVAKPPTPITPKQARDAGLLKEIVDANSQRPAGALQLAAMDDTQAGKVFGK